MSKNLMLAYIEDGMAKENIRAMVTIEDFDAVYDRLNRIHLRILLNRVVNKNSI